MSFGSALYQLLIGPLELMFEVIFAIADRLVGNHVDEAELEEEAPAEEAAEEVVPANNPTPDQVE